MCFGFAKLSCWIDGCEVVCLHVNSRKLNVDKRFDLAGTGPPALSFLPLGEIRHDVRSDQCQEIGIEPEKERGS